MKLFNWRFTCSNQHSFVLPRTDEMSYGSLVLYNTANELRFVDTFKDPVFEEIMLLVEKHPRLSKLDEDAQADLVQQVFGLSCDEAPSGGPFLITLPHCPQCNTHQMINWGQVYPVEPVEIDVLPATHERWGKMSKAEKMGMIEGPVPSPLGEG